MESRTLVKSHLKAFFVDLDGTLINSLDLLRQVYFKFLEQHHIQGSFEEFHTLMGKPLKEVFHTLKKRYSLKQTAQELYQYAQEVIQPEYLNLKVFDDTYPFIEQAEKLDIALYVTTASDSHLAHSILEKNGIRQAFQDIYTPDKLLISKQDPAFFDLLLKKLKLKSSETILIDDSPIIVMNSAVHHIPAALISRSRPYYPLPSFSNLMEIYEVI